VEWNVLRMISLQAGYRLAPFEGSASLYGVSAGLNILLFPVEVSYAYQPLGGLAQAHRFTVSYTFIPPARWVAATHTSAQENPNKSSQYPAPTPDMSVLPSRGATFQPSSQNLAAKPVSLSPEEKRNAIRAFLRGRDYYEQRLYDLAIREFEKALAIYPDYVKARRALSWAKRDRARQMLAGVVRPGVQRETAQEAKKLYDQGRELESKGKLVDAAFAYKSALLLMPEYEDAQKSLKRVQAAVTKTSAQPSLNARTDKSNGGAANLIKNSKAAAGRMGAPEEVISNIQSHHASKPQESPDASGGDESLTKAIQKHFLLGNQALDQGDYAQASREFELILEFDPEHKQALYKLNMAKTKMSEAVEASKIKVKEAKNSGDNISEVNALRELVILNPNDAAARQAFNDAKKNSRKQIDELYKKGVTLYAQGNYTDAIQIWNEVLDLEPEYEKAKESIKKAREKLELTNE